MAGNCSDNSQWLSINEDSLFLHDGLIRVTDLVELPGDVSSQTSDAEHEVITFDTKNTAELTERILSLCGTQNNAYARLLEYRLNALKGLWNAQFQMVQEHVERENVNQEETIALLKKQGVWQASEHTSFASRLSLLLLFPLLQSQSKKDEGLCDTTTRLLLQCLRECAPHSLNKEPGDCLDGLESLLCNWLGENDDPAATVTVRNPNEKETAASALVALACARGSMRSFVNTIHLLQNLPDIASLPVAPILSKLLELEGGIGSCSSILGSKHVICWGFEDMLSCSTKKDNADKDKDIDYGRSLACDGKFLYSTSSSGQGLAKIGNGYYGTLRGLVYAKNNNLGPGRLAWGNNLLLFRPHEFDGDKDKCRFALIINAYTLKVESQLMIHPSATPKQLITTIQFCSDGHYFYWIWCPGSASDKATKGQSIFLDVFNIEKGDMEVSSVQKRILLQRKDETAGKSLNEALLSRLRPYRPAAAASLVVLSGSPSSGFGSTQETSGTSTSCGLALKTLLKAPIYVCGNSVVILTSSSSNNSSATARSLFGSSSSLASLRSLATNLCFNVKDGLFVNRYDLIDAPTCGLFRGAQLQGLGICYDAFNNMIWTCSNDWVDQFYNPGHQASHHIYRQLGIDLTPCTPPVNDRFAPQEVIRQLLQHVGIMCCHLIASDVLHAPLSAALLQQQVFDLPLLPKVLDILEVSVRAGDDQIICCTLVILQVIFKAFRLEKCSLEEDLIKRTSTVLWQLLVSARYCATFNCINDDGAKKWLGVQAETCNAICSGLTILYPKPAQRNALLHELLSHSTENPAFAHLRDLILNEYTEELQSMQVDRSEAHVLWLEDDLILYLLKSAVKESCDHLLETVNANDDDFEKRLLSVPLTSSCVGYLSALQNYFLREAVLSKVVDGDDEEKLSKAQHRVLNFVIKVFGGVTNVFEVLLDVCGRVNDKDDASRDFRITGLERFTKATILGHLLPVLITSLTHTNLKSVHIAESVMPQLVKLVVLSSQAALLLRRYSQATKPHETVRENVKNTSRSAKSDLPCDELAGVEELKLGKHEEMGFFSGLKIPAPWARGCTLESIHPVRDSYKFKETVHIPGARCLYLRFDPRCSSQYDYDKLIVYSGPDANSHKVAEYGGNTFGYGSRSVLGSGWPKDLVKVEGDTVTLAFEMRSGREHNTPDKAMWGFLVSVRAQESTETISNGLPFVADLALGLSILSCTMLKLLYQGPACSPEEKNCSFLLRSKFLQRCVRLGEGHPTAGGLPPAPQIPSIDLPIDENSELDPSSVSTPDTPQCLSADFLRKVRSLSSCVAPQLRPSIRSVLHVDALEDKVVATILRHAGFPTTLSSLATLQEQSGAQQKLCHVMSHAYRKLDSLIRRLQALAELEQRWQSELEDIQQGMMPASMAFFADYHFSDSKMKELAMLCFLKGVDTEGLSAETVVHNLREKLEAEAYSKDAGGTCALPFSKTRQLVATIFQRAEILLSVLLEGEGCGVGDGHSSSEDVEDTSLVTKPVYSRSISAPSQVGEFALEHLTESPSMQSSLSSSPSFAQKKRLSGHWGRYSTSILDDMHQEEDSPVPRHTNPPTFLDQLFAIVSCQPEKYVSASDFHSACEVRKTRGVTRRQSLVHMKDLLTAALRVGGATHLVAAVTSVLQDGPKIDELTCGGMVTQVREAFSETITSVVQLAARYPLACYGSIGLLCVIPYTQSEEKCLVRSGLVQLLDRLCSIGDTSSCYSQNLRQRVAAMAWAGFQVLSNCCVSWENEDEAGMGEPGESGLAQQVATLLTNHLARATDGNGSDVAGNEALQDVLSLLNSLSRSKMGKAILSQPTCVSKLLSLLLDQRPSPKLVLVILQLCRTALPLMSAEDCIKVTLPNWGGQGDVDHLADVPSQIASLLLAKLGDYVIPGFQTMASPGNSLHEPSGLGDSSLMSNDASAPEKGRPEEADAQEGRLSVYVYKHTEQSVHYVIQPLLGVESRLFQSSGSENADRVERITRDLVKYGRAEVCTEDALSALRFAAKLAQNGLVVSTGPPVEKPCTEQSSDKKKITVEVICKEKNAELVKTDPVRAFISGQVANSMASEVIALLHGLLTATTAKIWASAVERVLGDALACLPQLLKQIETIGGAQCSLPSLLHMSRRIVATLCALGGFRTTLKPGAEVLIAAGVGKSNTRGIVMNIAETQGLAIVKLDLADQDLGAHVPDSTVQVPLSRLITRQNEPLPLQRLSLTQKVVEALQVLLVPEGGKLPLQTPLPIVGDGNSLAMAICRIMVEIRTRACMVLAHYLRDQTFAVAFMQHSAFAVEFLKSLAKDCPPCDRQATVEAQCERLRMLYRDCAKPPPPPNKNSGRSREITWNTTRAFPPVRASLFSHGLTGITFLGDPSARSGSGSGLPRGTFIYASQPVPPQAPSFYWELEVCSLGDPQEDRVIVVSFGFAPSDAKKDSAWSNPIGTVLFHNNGRAVHYNGSSLLQWKSVRLDVNLTTGDIAGCGWERTGDSPELLGQPAKGVVFFTHNGQRLAPVLDGVAGGLWPVVHIQKKSTRVKANFGARPFSYADGQHHLNAAHEASESTEEISANFGLLPFPGCSDSESDISERAVMNSSTEGREVRSPPGAPCCVLTTPKVCREYSSEASLLYRLQASYGNLTTTGPDLCLALGAQESDSDADEAVDDHQQEDHYALLVKAWESRVFPVIRRRFRNEAERKDGLEQIRGALQLGMTDIARQTVEFLYEENGGIPRDLHLPTIEDIKDEISRFTIDRIKKGMGVIVRHPSTGGSATTTVLPKFAVPSMLKTFGLPGTVLDVDHQNELVQAETYLRSEGVLVRFWYPLDVLERPSRGLRKTAVTGAQILDINSVHVHRELLHLEHTLARMYCRSALLELTELCNRPDLPLLEATGSSTAVAASASVFQELDVEYLHLLSDNLLTSASSNGTILDRSLASCRSPKQAFAADSCLATDLFYADVTPLRSELTSAIGRAASQGEDYLVELTNQLAACIQLAPENFLCDEVHVADAKLATDVHFPGAAFLVVSCKADPKSTRKDASQYKSPWARVFCYSGNDFKKNGQPSRQEVICYPRTTSLGSNAAQAAQAVEPYPPVLLACDRIHLCAGATPSPGAIICIHAIPAQFPLAMAYFEELLAVKWKELHSAKKSTEDEEDRPENLTSRPPLITSAVLLQVIELLSSYLWRTDVPPCLKECVFHLLAELLRTLHHSEEATNQDSVFSSLGSQLSASLALLLQLQSEVRKLYEEEAKTWSSDGFNGNTERGRFSSYFHALMEVSLAVSEVTSPLTPTLGPPALPTVSEPGSTTLSSSPISALAGAPPSPSASNKRKKLKAKRDRDRASPKSRSGSSSPRSSVHESDQPGPSGMVVGASTSLAAPQGPGGGKPEDVLWFHRALTMSEILRFLVYGGSRGSAVIGDAVADAFQSLTSPTVHSRLLAITGIPQHLNQEVVKRAIHRALRGVGGVFKDELFVPRYADGGWDHSRSPVKSTEETEPSLVSDASPTKVREKLIAGFAIVEIRSKAMIETARKALFKCKALLDNGSMELGLLTDEILDMGDNNLSISTVTQNLQLPDPEDSVVLDAYLKAKLLSCESDGDLTDEALAVMTDIFHSCFIVEQHLSFQETKEESGFICLNKDQIMNQVQGNLLNVFLNNIRPANKSLHELVSSILQHYGFCKKEDKEYTRDEKPSEIKHRSKKSTLRKSYKERLARVSIAEKSDDSEKRETKDEKSTMKTSIKESSSEENSSKEGSPDNQCYLTLDGFIRYVSEKAQSDPRSIWQCLLASGYDLHFERFCCTDISQAQLMSKLWTHEMDCALVHYVNSICRRLSITPARLHPHEIYLSQSDLANADYACLQGVPPESLRLRFALLQSLNGTLETFFLPLIDLRPARAYRHSMAAMLSRARGLILYDTKTTLMNDVLNATTLRKSDQAPPEISLDPIEMIGTELQEVCNTHFCQAMLKLKDIPSSKFCVQLASGGDPTYAFNVRLVGEEVHGTSGSFRHFLSQVSRELQSSLLPLFTPCPSAAASRNKGKYVLHPGSPSYTEEKMLEFFGQLLGITIRADIPLPIDLVPAFWKCLVDWPLDPITDLQDVDVLTYNYIKEFDMVENALDLSQLLEEHHNPHFVYTTLTGEKVELCLEGQNIPVCWENHSEYVTAIRELRMRELASPERYLIIKAGLASIIPIQLCHLLTPLDLELRTCGIPEIDLSFLKAHTMYQVGLMETDAHIRFFWNALESLSQEELRNFIKFACNQDRIPSTCPCKDGRSDTVHVPPYPMKIAPPEGRSGSPDSRYIRVETCMFMLKLPQYSSQEIMTERLLYAINCREDPLSG